jgi:hypothetical protein
MTEKNFIKDLDLLVYLLHKLKNKVINNNHDIDESIFQSFDMIMNNYNMVRSEISDNVLSQFGGSTQNLIAQMISQLKKELDEMETKERNYVTDLKRIDQLLMAEGLTDEEIDRLLDKRSQITAKKVNSNS